MLKNNFWERFYRGLIDVLPGVLFFSYFPLMHFGASESMNFELSLPLLWLVLFDLVAFLMMVKRKRLLKGLKGKWMWLLFPIFLTISIIWSLNSLRGILTTGILWLLYFAIYAMFNFKGELGKRGFKERFWQIFFGSTLFVCGWCLLQCFLDLIGVSREYSLMCAGCTYQNFGFPHPNGFAIEPQFMGNLLLAPTIVAMWFLYQDKSVHTFRGRGSFPLSSRDAGGSFLRCNRWKFLKILMVFVFAMTLFLTFSRGAIYAFLMGMILMTGFWWGRERKKATTKIFKIWGVLVAAFLMALTLQGVMAAWSPTEDTYFGGVAKALNHLSLGIIDVRENNSDSEKEDALELEITGENEKSDEKQPVEKPVENSATFDGYVEESTSTRLRLSEMAVKVWAKDLKTMLFGVGIGGAGQALYVNGLTDSPKEIIQNQYMSLLLETGIVGIMLLILTIVLMIKVVAKSPQAGVAFAVILAYGISLLFFAGLPNALQVYLMPAVVLLLA